MAITTDVSICNAALTAIGADPITSLTEDDETREAQICTMWYPTVVANLISEIAWKFSLNEATLALSTGVPLMDNYQYAYALPDDYIRIVATNISNRDFRIVGNFLYTNYPDVAIRYQFIPDESSFRPYFTIFVQYEMSKILSVALLESEAKANLFSTLAKEQRVRARFIDSSENPNFERSDIIFPFTYVRSTDGS